MPKNQPRKKSYQFGFQNESDKAEWYRRPIFNWINLCYILTFDNMLVVDFQTGYSTCVDKRIAEMNHVNWEPKVNVWALKILYNDKRLGRIWQRFGQTWKGSGPSWEVEVRLWMFVPNTESMIAVLRPSLSLSLSLSHAAILTLLWL